MSDRRGIPGQIWFWGRIALLVVLAGHAAWYARDAAREAQTIRGQLLTRIPANVTPRERIVETMHLAFQLPPHRGVDVDYGLKHPLMKLLRPSALKVYEHGGHCAKRTRLLTILLEEQGIPAHKLFLYNERGLELLNDPPRAWVHVAVEAQLDDRWVLVDPLFDVVFEKPDGDLATAENLRENPDILRAGRARADERYDIWEDSLYTYQDVRRFPWFMIPVVGELKHDVLAKLLGHDRADWIVTPLWMEEPQTAIVILSLVGMGLVGLTFVPWRRREKRRL
jgi:hypothetical protein